MRAQMVMVDQRNLLFSNLKTNMTNLKYKLLLWLIDSIQAFPGSSREQQKIIIKKILLYWAGSPKPFKKAAIRDTWPRIRRLLENF